MTNFEDIPQPILDLDEVLKYIASQKPPEKNNGYFHIAEVAQNFKVFETREVNELSHIVKKLRDNGFILVDRDNDGDYGISITWNGRVHFALDGYSGKFRQKHYSEFLEKKDRNINERIGWMTLIMAIATTIQAFGVLWQIFHQ